MRRIHRVFLASAFAAASSLIACSSSTPPATPPDATRTGGNRPPGTGGAPVAPGTGGAIPGTGGSDVPTGSGGTTPVPPDATPPEPDAFTPPPPPDPTATEVKVFAGTHVYFAGMDNKRKVDADVAFPEAGPWKQVTMKFALRCPMQQCDWWDRWGYIGVTSGPDENAPVTEIMRFATPFRVQASFTADVTALQPLLKGNKRLRVFIDTWVGPGRAANGLGWLVDVSFAFSPGKPTRTPIAVLPLWDVSDFEVGDPAKPVAMAVPVKSVAIPSEAGAVELRSFITGHGQGNYQNCAEFCPKNHAFTIGSKVVTRRIWRDDCHRNPVQPQGGSWEFPRAGWCPGALAVPWVEDVSAGATAGTSIMAGYAPEAWVNTCRPDAPMCGGCVRGNPCAYNDSTHTAPKYAHSALLVVYAKP